MYMADSPSGIKLEKNQFQKMVFIMNALEKGWKLKSNTTNIFLPKNTKTREKYLKKII